jgi:pimeloyl-ACP methyl ester carboxylesterase
MIDRSRRPAAVAAAVLAAGAARWTVVHRRSPAVRAWRPGGGARRTAGPLSVRVAGGGDRTAVLLHGITASGDVFGASWDPLAADHRMLVPDLLGFGRSMDERRTDFSLADHLDALDEMLTALDVNHAASLTIVGHSLGALVGLHWASRCERVGAVAAFSAPLYRDAVEADERLRAMGPMERLLALESPASEAACAWMCRHRRVTEWITVALEPRWPVVIARYGVHHTWRSYLGAMNGVIRAGRWDAPLRALDGAGVPVLLAEGARDRVPVPGRAVKLADTYANIRLVIHPTADHELPITHPGWCLHQVQAARGD